MPIALLLPHAGPASSGRHAVALMTGRHQAESKMRPATLSYQSSLDLQRLPRARINNLHTTFAYHIPIPLQKESIILIYRYHTGKCRTLMRLRSLAAALLRSTSERQHATRASPGIMLYAPRGRDEPSDRRGGASRVGSLITGSGAEPQKKILPLKRFLGLKTRTQRT